jgi:hypothetical protein
MDFKSIYINNLHACHVVFCEISGLVVTPYSEHNIFIIYAAACSSGSEVK